ncbi:MULTISPECIES: tryptophan synthase subunit alpha [unclassified Streptomyces]|uniref:tryptophan synthase subunit alpha n=1 Tax=unclassified Streptomyces TaxID=2593676 RepID=UPI002E16FC7B|nr:MULTISPECIES: tryptophan synthase subunit alpha [unclassified Streptomyces]
MPGTTQHTAQTSDTKSKAAVGKHHDASLDGPVIQAAYRRALKRRHLIGRTLHTVEHAANLRPTVVMTYWEPVSRHGPDYAKEVQMSQV